jgi:hypothetical protein
MGWILIILIILVLLLILILNTNKYRVTAVSGFWNINGKHSFESYSRWFDNTLSLDCPYVFFYEDENVREFISKKRKNIPTTFMKKSINDFSVNNKYKNEWVHDEHVPGPDVGKIWIEKVNLIREAAVQNFYDTEWFMWVDAGNAFYRDKKPPSNPWPFHEVNMPKDKIIYTGSNENEHDFAGTAFMYHKNICDTVSDLFYEQFKLCSENENNWTCGSDQCIFTELKKRQPELFHRIGEGYGNLIENI